MSRNKKFVTKDINDYRKSLRTNYINKYFNMFMHQYKWTGLEPIQEDYIMRKFWDTGTVAAFKIKNTDEIGLTQWATMKWNMYDFPEEVQLINKWNVPFMPSTPQIVNKDVVLGWIQANHKPISFMVNHYIDRMVEVDMVINTNLTVHKLPFLIGVTPADVKKANDIIDRILNDEAVIFMDAEDINLLNSVSTNAPYIIDKLYSYRTSLENELLTYLGIDNILENVERERMLVDEVNANNESINANQEAMLANLKYFTDKVNEVLGFTISVEPTVKPVQSVYDNGKNKSGGNENDNNQ